jgi:hypothetical protein
MKIAASHINFPCYIFYTNGDIYSLPSSRKKHHNGRLMRPVFNGRYNQVGLSDKNKKTKTITIHKIISEVFLGERPRALVVDHIDGNKFNNKLKNLRYISPQHNVARKIKLNSRNSSGYRGLFYLTKKKRWVVKIREHQKIIFASKHFKLKKDAIIEQKKVYAKHFENYD